MSSDHARAHRRLLDLVTQALTRAPNARDGWLVENSPPETLSDARRFLALAQTAHNQVDTAAATLAPVLALEGRQVGAFRIEHLLGAGGMGQVYRAARVDGEFEQTVAVKIVRTDGLHSAVARQFMIERQVLSTLRHPNIAALLDSGTTPDGLHYVVMEYVDGVTLDQYLHDHNLSGRAVVELVLKVCRALQVAHQALIIHRDIKPHNILVTADGEPKLVDFGIAKTLRPDGMSAAANTVLGALTPAYASPEQLRGESLTTASDVFALGIVLYHALTGESPYDFGARDDAPLSVVAVEQALARSQVIAPSACRSISARRAKTLRGDLDAIVLRALAPEAARRYGDAQALADDLERYLHGRPVSAQRDSRGYRLRKLVARNKTATAAVALTACAVVIGLGVSTWQTRMANTERIAAEAQLQRAEAVSDFLGDILLSPSANWDGALQTGANATISDVLDAAQEKLQTALPDLPDVRIGLLAKISEARLWMHQIDAARALMRAAIESADRELPATSPLRVQVRYQLANTFLEAWDYPAAIAAFEAALEVGEANNSIDDLTWMYIVDGKALAHSQLGEFELAVALQTQVAARWHAVFGDEPMPAWAEGYASKAYYEMLTGDLDAAWASLARATTAMELFPEETAVVRADLFNQKAAISYLQRRDDEALALRQKALEAARILFAEDVDKEEYAYAASALAMRWCDRGELLQAVGVLNEIEVALGDYLNDADGWLYHEARASCANAAGQFTDALAHAAVAHRLGTAEIMAAGAVGRRERTLAVAYLGLGQTEQARAAAQRSLAAYRQWLGDNHIMTRHVEAQFAELMQAP